MRGLGGKFAILSAICIAQTETSFGATGLTAGIPAVPCSKIIEMKDDAQTQDWINFWLKGFWTGLNWSNHFNSNPLKNLSDSSIKPDALKARVLAYCYENPNAILMEVAIDFYGKLPKLPAWIKFEDGIAP